MLRTTTILLLLVCSCHSMLNNTELGQILKGRCFDYQRVLRRDLYKPSEFVDCDAFWEKFNEVIQKKKCDWTYADFEPLMESIDLKVPDDISLFWSQVAYFVSSISNNGQRFVSIANSMIGFPLDKLVWCSYNGTETAPCSERCVKCDERPYKERISEYCRLTPIMNAFWQAASKKFASEATGVVTVMLNNTSHRENGEPLYPYFAKTTFAKFELPNFNPSKVSLLKIVLVQSLGKWSNVTETCVGDKSLFTLRERLDDMKIKHQCEINPPEVLYQLCVDDPDSDACSHANAANKNWSFAFLFTILSVLSNK